MTKHILLSILILVVGFLAFVASRPSDYVIRRQITIAAPPEKIFSFLDNSKRANEWQPWSKLDPDAKMEFSGPEAGVGSQTKWTGGEKLGVGSATIVESFPNERVAIRLEYSEPMTMSQNAEYLIQADGEKSIVIWKVSGKNTFFGRLICFFVNMDKEVGDMFEQGLANLKTLVEQPAAEEQATAEQPSF